MLLAHFISGLLLGAVSLPHCALMCGPLAASLCTQKKGPLMQGALALLMARSAGYALLGAILAVAGAGLLQHLPVRSAEAVLALAMGAYLLWMAVRIIRAPSPALVPLRTKKPEVRKLKVPAWALGLGISLLPCGALWGAYLVASLSGGPSAGAITMLGFSVASSPALGAAAGLSKWLRMSAHPVVTKLLSSAIFAGAIVMMWRAYEAFEQTGGSCCAG